VTEQVRDLLDHPPQLMTYRLNSAHVINARYLRAPEQARAHRDATGGDGTGESAEGEQPAGGRPSPPAWIGSVLGA